MMADAAPGNNDWLSQLFGGLGLAGGSMWNMNHPGKNPGDVANGYINQIPGQTQQYYSPYQQAGKGAMSDLQNQNKGLFGGTTQNQLGESYKESPGYKFALEQALAGGNNAAAAGGQLGLPQHEQQNMGIAQGLAAKDYNDYMNRQTDLYKTGYAGTQDINKMGFDANKSYSDMIANALSQQAGYGFAGQAGQNAMNASNSSGLFKGLGMLGGGLAGGPVGSAVGGWLGSLFGGK